MASKKKELHEKHQAILARLLRDEDNKYCVDCDTKGPRWASWNLGIFLCIRCAGIHRNLGVHISKVKSINLDSWQPEQIAMMEDMGNSRARAVYEANLPDNYKRPSTSDQSMEQFIRAKYEHKKYIAREWVPPTPRSYPSHYQDEEKKKERKSKPVLTIPGAAAGTTKAKEVKPAPQTNQNNTAPTTNGVSNEVKTPASSATQPDLLGDFMSSSNLTAVTQPSTAAKLASEDLFSAFGPTNPPPTQPSGMSQPGAVPSNGDNSDLFSPPEEKSKSAKDSIMALYGNSPQMQQPTNQPGFQQGMQPGIQHGYQQAYNMQGSYGQAAVANNMMYANMQQQNPNIMGMYSQPVMTGMQRPVALQAPAVGMQPQMGYYAQPQQNMMYANQLQSQMANMSINQPQMGIQQNPVAANKPQTNGQTLNFDLWN